MLTLFDCRSVGVVSFLSNPGVAELKAFYFVDAPYCLRLSFAEGALRLKALSGWGLFMAEGSLWLKALSGWRLFLAEGSFWLKALSG
jgi:hypothetical protein